MPSGLCRDPKWYEPRAIGTVQLVLSMDGERFTPSRRAMLMLEGPHENVLEFFRGMPLSVGGQKMIVLAVIYTRDCPAIVVQAADGDVECKTGDTIMAPKRRY